jgi:hydrogenase maturation protein HypF
MDIKANVPVPIIAARFHNSIAAAVLDICCQIRHNYVVNKVALSGGVWQNITLLDHTNSLLLSNGFEVLTHTKVPVNDGGLALGQAIVAVHWLKEKA